MLDSAWILCWILLDPTWPLPGSSAGSFAGSCDGSCLDPAMPWCWILAGISLDSGLILCWILPGSFAGSCLPPAQIPRQCHPCHSQIPECPLCPLPVPGHRAHPCQELFPQEEPLDPPHSHIQHWAHTKPPTKLPLLTQEKLGITRIFPFFSPCRCFPWRVPPSASLPRTFLGAP